MKTKSGIIYRGPSRIDGQPIVAIAIAKSRNTKNRRHGSDIYSMR